MIPAREDVRRVIEATGTLAGAEVTQMGSYPSWRPDIHSPLLKRAKEIYREMYETVLEVKATHGGLETAIIGGKFPGMDMISIGSTMHFPHSPDERVHIPSVMKFYNYLKGLLEKL